MLQFLSKLHTTTNFEICSYVTMHVAIVYWFKYVYIYSQATKIIQKDVNQISVVKKVSS